jgi:Leucine-rich repeat (LRR) protein
VISLNNKFSLYPDDRSNQFGNPNDLDTNGGVFDYNYDAPEDSTAAPTQNDASQSSPEYDRSDAEAVSEAADLILSQSVSEPVKTAPQEKPKPRKKGSGAKTAAFFLLIIILTLTLGVVFYLKTNLIFGSLFGEHVIYPYGTKEINLSGSDYEDYSGLSGMKSLEVIDLTNSSFKNLSDLYGCGKLRKIILADRELRAEDCIELYRRLPDAELVCRINVNGEVYDSDVKSIKVENADSEGQRLYAALRSLKSLDMTACDVSDDTFQSLAEELPKCIIIVRTTVCGKEYTTDEQALRLSGELTADDVLRIGYFRNLNTIDLGKCKNAGLLDDFLAANPDIKLSRIIDFLGKSVSTADDFVDLRGSKYTLEQVKAGLDEVLPQMNSLKKIDMCGCGLSNSDMEKLCAAYPDIKFVWMIHFVKWYVRTDAVAFSSLNSIGKSVYTQDDYAPLFKYCTDLVALDLGHSRITDISGIASMKNLRAVILTDNKITDISAFAQLKKLELIEMNATNKVKSVEPLRDLPNLKYINLWGSMGITDLSPLYNHENLKIVIFERTIDKEEQERFIKSNPNCDTYFKVDSNKVSTNPAWRNNPARKKLKEFLCYNDQYDMMWRYVTGFDEETGEYIIDYNSDQYKYK